MDSSKGYTATTCPVDGHNWKPSKRVKCIFSVYFFWKCSLHDSSQYYLHTYTTLSKQLYSSMVHNLQGLSSVCHALYLYIPHKHHDIGISSFSAAVLRGTPYQNNSIVTLEDIGEGDDALLCITTLTACCRPPDVWPALGNWFFPNGTRVPSSGYQWDFHRTRGQMVVSLHRRRGGVEGIYRCEIPDAVNVNQTIYIGVYSASTGEWYVCCSGKLSVSEPHTRNVTMSEPQTSSGTVSEPHMYSGRSSVREPHSRYVNMSEPQTHGVTVRKPHI